MADEKKTKAEKADKPGAEKPEAKPRPEGDLARPRRLRGQSPNASLNAAVASGVSSLV